VKKWIIRIVIGILLLLVALIAYVELNKSSIVATILEDATSDLDADLAYEDIDVSLLSTFPYMGIGLEGITLTSTKVATDTPLLKAGKVAVKVDLLSAIKGEQPIPIKGLELTDLHAYLLKDKEGLANYNIYESETTTEETAASLELEKIVISGSTTTSTSQV